LPDALLLPAHGPTQTRVHPRVEALLAHHDARLADCAAAVTPGPATPYVAARQLGWTRRLRPFDRLDPFDQMLAVFETEFHLAVLTDRGVLGTDEVDGVRRYFRLAG
jgi:hypothetical protein